MDFESTILPSEDRHKWSLGVGEQYAIQALIANGAIRKVFEIGTFNGATTRLIAECLPDDGHITTVDLPAEMFDARQSPDAFTGSDVGMAFKGSAVEYKITQLRVDSVNLDTSAEGASYDLVLVDGAHDYEHGVADSRTALSLVAPDGIVLWDDCEPFWHGLVRGIVEVAGSTGNLKRIAGTSLLFCRGA
jgi:predicted O-methyltransferase YrrM